MRIPLVAAAVAAGLILLRKNRKLAVPLALVWVVALFCVAFLARQPYAAPRFVLDPFHALKLSVQNRSAAFLEGALLNLLIFVPVGCLLPLLWKRVDSCPRLLLCAFALSLCVELLQLVTRCGMFDLDDLMHNTLGALLGWLCYTRFLRNARPG